MLHLPKVQSQEVQLPRFICRRFYYRYYHEEILLPYLSCISLNIKKLSAMFLQFLVLVYNLK